MNVEKMRRQLERSENAYQWRALSRRERPPISPALRQIADRMLAMKDRTIRLGPVLGTGDARPLP